MAIKRNGKEKSGIIDKELNIEINKKHSILIVIQQYIVVLDLQKELEKNNYIILYGKDFEDACLVTRIVFPDFIIIENNSIERLGIKKLNMYNEIEFSSSKQNGVVVTDKQLNIIAFFKKPFNALSIANFINDYVKN